MPDNYVTNAPTGGGPSFASDEIGGVQHPRVKVQWGADGTVADASAAAPIPVALTGIATAPALTIFRSLDVDESEEEIKATSGRLFRIEITNRSTAARAVKLYNATLAGTTVGTTTPLWTYWLEGSASIDADYPLGLPFSTALCVAATTGLADDNTGAPSANDVTVHALYA
jgi:hypothetical protein